MRAHQIMSKNVITVTPDTTITDAARIMLEQHVSGLPVTDAAGRLVGIVSEGDFLRRSEIGTQHKRASWLQFLVGPGRLASEFTHERGRKVGDVMTRDPVTVSEDTTLDELVAVMERNRIKRLPVMRHDAMVGIVTRSNLLQAVAGLAREIPDPTADDDRIRDRINRTISDKDWRPLGLQVVVRNGVVHLHGIIVDDRSRKAAVVAAETTSGVKEVHDHLCWVDAYSGAYLNSEEDERAAKAS